MNRFLKSALLRTGTAVACTLIGFGAQAQGFPNKPITIVVPYAAGGPTDITARRLAEGMGKTLSTTVLVENRPGAATTLGAAYVARAPKDGYTLLMAPGSTTSINPYIYSKLTYKFEDFAPVSQVSRQGFALTAAPNVPVKNMKEFVAWAKSKDSPVTYATTGTGSLTNILGEWVGRTLGVKMTEVPYKGTAAAYADLLGGRVDINVEGLSSAITLHNAGKMKVIGVMTEERSPQMPEVGTMGEAGYPKLIAYTNFGLLAPADTPTDVIKKLHAGVVAAVADAEFTAKLAAGGEQAVSSKSPKQFGDFLKSEYVQWGEIVKPLNLKLD
ncbi:Bug family tripartite tricarboxylate transporter substrate binding protein [Hydrogenophaga sp. BPS33]|uniref:Bug family tripartite tricarboxylate transporter substrate binding protein n=1 Tax=Hydrogenophaga sp. BPS33 TaxID=2651974 RepID=UPI0013203DEE|nr:tripartite tricarboxylate transporter substrate binding protein [Hydrogenophaga sp. BPS33]QHE84796.1 tripartite tricarboxylate transporter substrate binding protein [Hydrogenophaga sp. BPS33]